VLKNILNRQIKDKGIELLSRGIAMAKYMGIYATDNFKDLFRLENLNAVIELTNSKALLELIASRPKGGV
jgi:hypothetical protein